jgi:hypothetical protein
MGLSKLVFICHALPDRRIVLRSALEMDIFSVQDIL